MLEAVTVAGDLETLLLDIEIVHRDAFAFALISLELETFDKAKL
jgi:hypothetical protein